MQPLFLMDTQMSQQQNLRAAKTTSCEITFDANTKCMTQDDGILGNKRNKKIDLRNMRNLSPTSLEVICKFRDGYDTNFRQQNR